MKDNISKIKDRLNIVDVISSYIKLQKSGANYRARCPFHSEKTASFYVSPERQIWHCFGCGLGGDMFGFIKQIEGVEFPEALKMLAGRAGIELIHIDPRLRDQKTKLLELQELAAKFFEKQLWHSDIGKKALTYLRDRGLEDESTRDFRLGYAPDFGNPLREFLASLKYDNATLVASGLVGKNDRGELYDRFRARIMFPIFDLNNQIVGFSGRIFKEGLERPPRESLAKYINTPQTLIYDKSRVLYGLNKAKSDLRKKDKCMVVEGNMDVVMSHQAGATNAVATSGTALTDGHLKIIKRFTENLDLCFDADSAGQIATDRGVDLALANGFNVGIIAINEKDLKDPADYVKRYGLKWVEYAQQSSMPFMEFYLKSATKLFDVSTAIGKKLASQKILPLIKTIANRIEQSHWVNELAFLLKIKQEIIEEELKTTVAKIAPAGPSTEKNIAVVADLPLIVNLDPLEETLVSLIIKEPSLAGRPDIPNDFLTEKVKGVISTISSSEGGIDRVIKNLETELALSLEFAYLKSQELWKDFSLADIEKEFKNTVKFIERRAISAQLTNLEFLIKNAEKERDKESVSQLSSQFSELAARLGGVS